MRITEGQITEIMLRDMARAVYEALGADHDEDIYKQALLIELRSEGFKYDCEQAVEIRYKDQFIGWGYADIIVRCGSNLDVLLELKKAGGIGNAHLQQARNYMKQLGVTIGFVINFACSGSSREDVEDSSAGKAKRTKAIKLLQATVRRVIV